MKTFPLLRVAAALALTFSTANAFAQQTETPSPISSTFGTESISNTFFTERYLNNDLVHWLDNMDDNVTYEAETTGRFNSPDPLIFSINGNSYRQNRYYLDGMRIDSRFSAGSTFYTPDMYSLGLGIDGISSGIHFTSDRSRQRYAASATYNMGGLGGISSGTAEMIHWFHPTATDRIYRPIEYRSKTQGAFTALVDLPQYQQIYLDLGRRFQVGFDEKGIASYFPEDYSNIQISGKIPFLPNRLFDLTNYIVGVRHRTKAGTEFYMGENESADQTVIFGALYGIRRRADYSLTTGLVFETVNMRHNDLCFSRNIIDQDGEAFEPWYPDAGTTDMSHAITYEHRLNDWLRLGFDGYNSILAHTPNVGQFHNTVYSREADAANTYRSLYVYEWQTERFFSGLLENTLSLKAERRLSDKMMFRADVDATLDGMILKSKSMIRPNWQLQAGFDIRPNDWFRMEVNMARKRIAYTINDIQFFSDNYLNGNVYYWNDSNADRAYQEGERGALHTSTGGACHSAAKNLKQQSYWVLDLPLTFRFGRHEIAVLNSFRKYDNIWVTQFDGSADDYGYMQSDVYFLDGGEARYKVVNFPKEMMTTDSPINFLTDSPFFFSNTIRYSYTTPKFFFSASWQSYGMAGISSGNGPLQNNIGVLSELTANPNNSNHKLVGRTNQDRAYIARILCSYKISNRLSLAMTGKFKDGQPFTNFTTHYATSSVNGGTQVALTNDNTKGINPFDGDFGCRKDAFFNIDVRINYRFAIKSLPCEIQACCYNIYDFGTELTEYTFAPYDATPRAAMSLNIPRGMMLTLKIGM